MTSRLVTLCYSMTPELIAINAMDDRTSKKHDGPYIGRPLPRFEDLRLVRGLGRYTDDLPFPGAAHAAFVRSPHPHARILRIDAAAARAAPGVLAVLTGDDYLAGRLRRRLAQAEPRRRRRFTASRPIRRSSSTSRICRSPSAARATSARRSPWSSPRLRAPRAMRPRP